MSFELKDVEPSVEKAIREYLAVAGAKWTTGIAAFQLYDRKFGRDVGHNTDAPCHAHVETCTHEGVVVNAMKASVSKKYRDFILWVCRESPYAYAVLNKDNESELLNNGMVIDLALCGRGGALWLCKAVRSCSELPHVPKVFGQLVAEGVDPLWAFVGASIIKADGSPVEYPLHGGLFVYGKPEDLHAFVSGLGPKNTTGKVSFVRPGGWIRFGHVLDGPMPPTWGSLQSKIERKPDGWGGYSEVVVADGVGPYAELIKKIAKEGKL